MRWLEYNKELLIMLSTRVVLILFAAMTAASCATAGGGAIGGDAGRGSAYETNRLVKDLDKSIDRLNESNAELSARLEATESEVRRLLSVAEENQIKLDQLQGTLDDLTDTIYRQFNLTPPPRGQRRNFTPPPQQQGPPPRQQEAPGVDVQSGGIRVEPPTPVVEPPRNTTPAPLDADAHYRQAQELYARELYREALEQFGSHLALFPDTQHASNAQYWKAHCHFKLGQFEEAIDEFQRLRTLYPDSKKVPLAIHNQAVSYSRLGQMDRAIELFKEVILEHPNDAAATSAREILRQLQGAN